MLLQVILEGLGLGTLLVLVCAVGIRKGAVGMVNLFPMGQPFASVQPRLYAGVQRFESPFRQRLFPVSRQGRGQRDENADREDRICIGIDPIQFGIIMVLNCGIGLLTPPVGAVLFIGSAVAKRPMEKVVKATLPFYLCMFIALLLLTFVPDISLAIPKLLGGYVSPIANPLGPVFIH